MREKNDCSEEISLFLMAGRETPERMPHTAILFKDGGCLLGEGGFMLYYPSIEMAHYFTGFNPETYNFETPLMVGTAMWCLESTDYGPM